MSVETTALAAVLDEACRLTPAPGYINGDEYSQWYVEAHPAFLRALAALARAQGEEKLADRLQLLSRPLCMAPLDLDPDPATMPKRWCAHPVEVADTRCPRHKSGAQRS
ncbi:hypothetical protein HNQ79_006500 [Streptomyces candidus]|uniref:Uncharacterized protein n=1 Tax=Streptomyces candidus TaxID=67283 RepID=A0A7X0HP83_9ACTN|nr:hypothetical protein [Streptomyces candidus]GHH57460.1 hypothetical protein GCM10018773_64840 [Streptomyces candidus]